MRKALAIATMAAILLGGGTALAYAPQSADMEIGTPAPHAALANPSAYEVIATGGVITHPPGADDSQRMGMAQAESDLITQGYVDVSGLSQQGDDYTGQAVKNGQDFNVQIDPASGRISTH